jgi:mannitol/fructose-specific phosphotransferase system IIA component (Ntr-type)
MIIPKKGVYINKNLSMKNWLTIDNIHLNLKAQSELEAIWKMLELAKQSTCVLDSKELARAVYENEVLSGSHSGTSGITFHALTDAVSKPLMIVGHFEKGIGYYSKEKKPIDLVLLLAAPKRLIQQLEDMIICVKEMLADCDFLESIRKADNNKVIYDYFQELCLKISLKKNVIKKATH